MRLSSCWAGLVVPGLLLAAASLTSSELDAAWAPVVEVLSPDDQCHVGVGACALSALQTRRATLVPALAPRQRKPAIFVHVHKSGGTTVCEAAEAAHANIPPSSPYCSYALFQDYQPDAIFDQSPASQRENLTCAQRLSVHGAASWSSIEHALCGGDVCLELFSYSTVLRDTIDRIRSQVDFEGPRDVNAVIACITEPGAKACASLKVYGDDFMYMRSWLYFDNFLVRTFAGCDAMNLPPGGVNESHYQAALGLLRQFDLVIPLDKLSSAVAVALMDRVWGWHVDPLGPHSVTHQHKYDVGLSEEQVRRLKEINRYDIALTASMASAWEEASKALRSSLEPSGGGPAL